MKKSCIIICTLVLLALAAVCPCALAEGGALEIDSAHIYSNMTRPYAQGYSPLVKGDYAYVVLPLLAGEREHSITARLVPDAPEVAPYKLDGLTQQFKPRSYKFGDERVQAYLISFRLRLYDDCMDGDYPLTVCVQDEGHETRYRIVLSVSGREPNPAAPQLELVDCAADLNVGENGELAITLANRSQTRAARDISMVFSDADGYVLPLNSDTVIIPDLAPGDSHELTLPVSVSASAPARPHAVQFTLKCSYGADKSHEAKLGYTLALNQRIRISYTSPSLPERVTQGDVTSMTLTVMNMGRGKLLNVLLTPNLPGLSSGGSVLLGSLEPGGSAAGSVNFRVDADALGAHSGQLAIYCEDEYGNSHVENVPLSTEVLAKPEPAATEEADIPIEGQSLIERLPWWLPWTIAGALSIALAAVIIASGRRLRNAEEQRL